MIPEKAQGKVLQATVVAVGSGARGKVNILKHYIWVELVIVLAAAGKIQWERDGCSASFKISDKNG